MTIQGVGPSLQICPVFSCKVHGRSRKEGWGLRGGWGKLFVTAMRAEPGQGLDLQQPPALRSSIYGWYRWQDTLGYIFFITIFIKK